MEAIELPLGIRRTRLSLQYCVKPMSNEVNPAYSAVFQSDIVATYEAKERAIKPLGLSIERHEVGFHTYVNTRRVKQIQSYIVYIILNCYNLLRSIHIFLLIRI